MFLVTFDFEHTYIKKLCLNMNLNLVKLAIKYFQRNFVIYENERQSSCNINIAKENLFSGSISHGASNEPEVYLEPSQMSMREHFCKNS